jgi:hypothetical protein
LTPHRRNRLLPLLLLACGAGACSSPKSVFPSGGSVALTVTDSALREQSTLARASQVVRWTIVSAQSDFVGYGTYAYTGVSPCTYTKNVLVSSNLEKACGGSNLVLGTGGAWTATVHLVISAMEVRRAFIPDLPDSGDQDGDGIANAVDNCPLVPNADQVLSTDATHGTACTITNGGIVNVDTDGDGTVDAYDDCVWVPDAAQTDSNVDGIGDACEQVARVVLDPVPLHLDLSPVTFNVKPGALSTLTVDFDDRKVLESCDAQYTRCTLDPEAVVVTVQ